jgi:hypothetical protein
MDWGTRWSKRWDPRNHVQWVWPGRREMRSNDPRSVSRIIAHFRRFVWSRSSFIVSLNSLELIERHWRCSAIPNWFDIHPTISSSKCQMIYSYNPRWLFDDELDDHVPPPTVSESAHWTMTASKSPIQSVHRSQMMPKYEWVISYNVKLARRGIYEPNSLSFSEKLDSFRNSSFFEKT